MKAGRNKETAGITKLVTDSSSFEYFSKFFVIVNSINRIVI